MKRRILLLTACVLPAILPAVESFNTEQWDSSTVVQWLWASEKPDHQAAAILLDPVATWPDGVERVLPDDEVAARLPALIKAVESQKSVELMTAVCSSRDWKSVCRQADLERAIERYANGNLLLRGLFLDADSDWPTAISEAPVVKDAVFSVTESIHSAYLDYLSDHPRAEWQEAAAVAAFAISMAMPHSYQALLDHCTVPGDGYREACLRIERQFQHEGNTLLTRAVGYAIERERLKTAGELQAAGRSEERAAALQELSACVGRSGPQTLSRTEFETWLDLGVDQGEQAAVRYLASEYDAECDLAAF
jgi:hypothetical protein